MAETTKPKGIDLDKNFLDDNKVNHTLITRAGWGAQEARGTLKPLAHPVKNVLIAVNTDVDVCFTEEACLERMRELQKLHMDKGMPDIHYNFAVGGDGNFYEGRGWDFQPGPFKDNPEYDEKSICIGLIGDVNEYKDTANYMGIFVDAIYLTKYGTENGYIEKEYFMAEDTQKF